MTEPKGAHRDTRPIRAQRAERREMKPLLAGEPEPSPAAAVASARPWWGLPLLAFVVAIALTVGVLQIVGYASRRQPALPDVEPIATATTAPVFEPTLAQVLDGYWWIAVQRAGLVSVVPDQQLSTGYGRGICMAIDADPTAATVEAQIAYVSNERDVEWAPALAYVSLALDVYCPTYTVLLP